MKLRLAPATYEFLVDKAYEGNYGKGQFARFLNDLAQTDLYPNPSLADKRITVSTGRQYSLNISSDSLSALDDIALSSGLPKDPSIILNNMYTGYIYPLEWPNAFGLLIAHNIPVPEAPLRKRSMEDILSTTPEKQKYNLTLVPKAFQFTTEYIENLVFVTLIDTRPQPIIDIHNANTTLGIPNRWSFPDLLKEQRQLYISTDVIAHLSSIANQFNIHGAKRDTPNALSAAVINGLAEGWLSIGN